MSRATLMRMVFNVILDTAAGAIPLLGDLFDFVWKSNRRNLDLLERHSSKPAKAKRSDRLWAITVFGSLGLICVGLLFGVALLVGALLKTIGGA